MAGYIITKYQEVFNPDNFNNINFFDISDIVFKSVGNIFTSVNTFMKDVLINGTLYVNDIQILNTFLGYNIAYFQQLKAPIQQQFDSITTGDNVIINSTVSVGSTISVDYDQPSKVINVGT